MPLLFGKGTYEFVAVVLIRVLWACEFIGEKEESWAENYEGSDKPEDKEQDEHVSLVFTLRSYSFEEDEEFVLVSWYILHLLFLSFAENDHSWNFYITHIMKNKSFHTSQRCSITSDIVILCFGLRINIFYNKFFRSRLQCYEKTNFVLKIFVQS